MLPRVLVSTGKIGFRVCGEGHHRAKIFALIIAHLPDEKQYIALDAGDGLCAWSIGQ